MYADNKQAKKANHVLKTEPPFKPTLYSKQFKAYRGIESKFSNHVTATTIAKMSNTGIKQFVGSQTARQ